MIALERSCLSYVLKALERLDIKPKKSLSQNFLIDSNIVRKIIKASNISLDDNVVEIGSGLGSLTEGLISTKARVIAIETDKRFFSELDGLGIDKIYWEDFTKFSLELLPKKNKLIANLPYHLTSLILTKCVSFSGVFSEIIVMVQEEIAQRIISSPGSKNYSSLSIFLNFFSDIEYLFKVSKNCFYPRPKVDSAIIKLTLREKNYLLEDREDFFNFVRTSFQKRRKTLPNSLETLFLKEEVEEKLKSLGLPLDIRGEKLSLEEFLHLYKTLRDV